MAGDAKGSPPLALLSGVRISSGIPVSAPPTRWESLAAIPAVLRGSIPPVLWAVVSVGRGYGDDDELECPGPICSAEAKEKDLTGTPFELFWGNNLGEVPPEPGGVLGEPHFGRIPQLSELLGALTSTVKT